MGESEQLASLAAAEIHFIFTPPITLRRLAQLRSQEAAKSREKGWCLRATGVWNSRKGNGFCYSPCEICQEDHTHTLCRLHHLWSPAISPQVPPELHTFFTTLELMHPQKAHTSICRSCTNTCIQLAQICWVWSRKITSNT